MSFRPMHEAIAIIVTNCGNNEQLSMRLLDRSKRGAVMGLKPIPEKPYSSSHL